jgi:hypothetical protein
VEPAPGKTEPAKHTNNAGNRLFQAPSKRRVQLLRDPRYPCAELLYALHGSHNHRKPDRYRQPCGNPVRVLAGPGHFSYVQKIRPQETLIRQYLCGENTKTATAIRTAAQTTLYPYNQIRRFVEVPVKPFTRVLPMTPAVLESAVWTGMPFLFFPLETCSRIP